MDQNTPISAGSPSFSDKLRTFSGNFTNFLREYASENPIFFLFILLMLPLTLLAVQQTVSYMSKAQTAPSVAITFSPTQIALPPDADVKIYIDSQSYLVAFARVAFTFDPAKIRLIQPPVTNPNLSTTVQITDVSSANSQGKMVIVIAASPSDTQPQGNFEFASLKFTATTPSAAGSTGLAFDTADIQIVESQGGVLTPNATTANVTLNGIGTTPSPTINPNIDATSCQGQNISSQECYQLWKMEYTGILSSTGSDLNNDGTVDMIDFEIWRRAAYP